MADFVIIYIDEAHATDGWAFNANKYKIRHHADLEDRITAARMLTDEQLPCPVVDDTMKNEARKWYGAMPERLFIILDGTVVYRGNMCPWGYSIDELNSRLEAITKVN